MVLIVLELQLLISPLLGSKCCSSLKEFLENWKIVIFHNFSFYWWIWWHIKEVFLNDITTKYIIATDLVFRHRSSIHESEFIKRLLLMSLSNEAVHQPQHSAVGIHLKSFLMKLMNWQPNEKSLSQISKSPHHITQWEKILRFKSHQRQNIQKSDSSVDKNRCPKLEGFTKNLW